MCSNFGSPAAVALTNSFGAVHVYRERFTKYVFLIARLALLYTPSESYWNNRVARCRFQLKFCCRRYPLHWRSCHSDESNKRSLVQSGAVSQEALKAFLGSLSHLHSSSFIYIESIFIMALWPKTLALFNLSNFALKSSNMAL